MITNRFLNPSYDGSAHEERNGTFPNDINSQNHHQSGGGGLDGIHNHSRAFNNVHSLYEGNSNTLEFPPTDIPLTDANLYIKNIDYDITDEVLYSVFSKLGEITSHHIVRDVMKRSRGFGFM